MAWIRDVLPSVTAVGAFVYNWMLRKINSLQKQKEALALKLKYKENKEDVEKDNAGKSDSDIINDAIRDGGDSEDPKD